MNWVSIDGKFDFRGDRSERYYYRELTLDQFVKWRWYFRYLRGLYQVKNPRVDVEMNWGVLKVYDKSREQRLLEGKKRTITKYRNKLNSFLSSYNGLFDPKQDPLYLKALEKVERLQSEYEEMLSQKGG